MQLTASSMLTSQQYVYAEKGEIYQSVHDAAPLSAII